MWSCDSSHEIGIKDNLKISFWYAWLDFANCTGIRVSVKNCNSLRRKSKHHTASIWKILILKVFDSNPTRTLGLRFGHKEIIGLWAQCTALFGSPPIDRPNR